MQRFVVASRHRASGDANGFERAWRHLGEALGGTSRRELRGRGARRGLIESSSAALASAYDRLEEEVKRDLLIEPELRRQPMASAALLGGSVGAGGEPISAGVGAAFTARLRGGEQALDGADATLFLMHHAGAGAGTRVRATSDDDGVVRIPYNPSMWRPVSLLIEPQSGFWSWLQPHPQSDATLQLPALPKTGPLGWWHQLLGIQRFDPAAGSGIKIGILDTGVGPHPYLSHVQQLGAILDGAHDPAESAGLDVARHGTHVAGILGARPIEDSQEMAGLAPGAELLSIRIFAESGGANQADLSEAIERLVEAGVDLISLNLGGEYPSEIERDAIERAAAAGVVCVAAAGDGFGQPLLYPAAYPSVASVAALGVVGASPDGTFASYSTPSHPQQFAWPLYAASFNNAGPTLICSAPGCGIISTVPARGVVPTPYADMSGSSVAAAVACGALATLLARDAAYLELPRGLERAARASLLLTSLLAPLGLAPEVAGRGMSRARAA